MRNFIVLILCFYFFTLPLNAQIEGENTTNESVSQIEQLKTINKFLEEDNYSEATKLLEGVITLDSSNFNAQFKMGICLLKSLDKRENAYTFLKKSTQKVTQKYDFTDVEIQEAPFDAFYFLAKAYLAINEPDSAIKNFKLYSDYYYGNPPIVVEPQIIMCYNAKANIKAPRNVTITNMGEHINSNSSEMNPVLTMDNKVVFFSSRRLREDQSNAEIIDKQSGMHNEDIYYAKIDNKGVWSDAKLFDHNSEGNDAPLFISSNGLTLYFRREINGNGDIFKSKFIDGVWSEPTPMQSGINSPFDETGLSISSDGQFLYFSSDRDGGYGESDIYQCKKKKNGKWGRPNNVGDVINSSANEISPFVHPNGKTLFFSTNYSKSKGLGGYDIYFSELNDDESWSEPQNMGYPINSTRDEFHYYITEGGIRYYNRPEKDKSFELYKIEGGGFDVETLAIGTEVITLTEEMDVAEVVEVVEEKEVEVEVVETIETEVIVESEVEVIDLEAMTEFEGDLSSDSLLDDSSEMIEEEEETTESMFAQLEIESLDSNDRDLLLEKVKNYLAKQIQSNNSTIFKTVYFNFNSSLLNLLNKNEQEVLMDFIKSRPETKINIIGYTDNIGSTNTNLILSNKRAKVVYDFIVKHGVDKSRIEFYGKGINNPIATNNTEIGRSKNRRVEVILTNN